MARRRKQTYDPRQLSFMMDIMADQIEHIRTENIQADLEEEKSHTGQNNVAALGTPENDSVQQELAPPYARLGVNSTGMTVYALKDGGRMVSRNPEIMQTMDGDKDTAVSLYTRGKLQYLTVEEVAAFTKGNTATLEVQNARQTDKPAGNSRDRSQARNDKGSPQRQVHQFSLFDSGQVGAAQPGRVEDAGTAWRDSVYDEAVWPAADGSADVEQRISPASEAPGDERFGDFAVSRDRYEPENYRITPDDQLGVGGAKTKYADNIAAIRLLKQLQEAGADQASPEEKKILVRYVGWGGLSQAFDPKNEQWAAEYQELQGLFSPDEYAKARRSTQDAHFTSETVIKGIYQGLSTLGMGESGKLRILEPSAGIGNFMGLCPENFDAQFLAVELDPTTAAMSKYLYPKARHTNNGFQNTPLNKDFFDAVVGNPPFGNQALYDPDYPELKKFSIHNYFISKSLDLLREGGVGAFVVSRYFMDAVDPSVREHIAQSADFLGAVRLPETAFRQNALTDVTTDIVFFQKNSSENKRSKDWTRTASIVAEDHKNGGTKPATVNSYFAANPGQIIGKMAYSGGMFHDALNCVADAPLMDLGHEITKRLEALPGNLYVPRTEAVENAVADARNEEFISSAYFQSL